MKNYRNMKADILFAIKITLIISIPLSILYRLFSEPLAVFLYNDKKVGEYLRILSYSTVFMALQHTFSGILQGLNKHTAITINRLIGMSIQLLLVYFLVGNPKFGINGFFIGFYLRIFVIFLLDLVTLRSIVKFRFRHIN
ncbi:MATE family efflux transporter [Sporanaerobacter acetigenes]|uniref:Polysaccharide biosynthesis C-terminal domain-containing protein n=1 Tax=Sporanaerobacter acetigenes DSM 13106 TaxID=1123281 RepID=A0A1M5S8C8_9FIRM|nr:polysaccharide biosynthesis C-terminal domain-containing protein [Sporanaerobacter acetigenes]SHH34756.1 Polysaccharide biosynthesis C-terminal domain-containing protein [Sporanaerobacter acetigenes DSM 13106]